MKPTFFSISKRLQSFQYAFNGLRILIKEEHNARIHLLATVLVVALSAILKITINEWIAVLRCIGFVFLAEILNTAIENLCDFVSHEKRQQIKIIKDLAAGAVLIATIISVVTACFIFIPKLQFLLREFACPLFSSLVDYNPT